MANETLKPGQWYWIRSESGTLHPYRFHRLVSTDKKRVGEFYVGSMLVRFSLGQVIGEAQPPQERSP